jgi:hypothetical protein
MGFWRVSEGHRAPRKLLEILETQELEKGPDNFKFWFSKGSEDSSPFIRTRDICLFHMEPEKPIIDVKDAVKRAIAYFQDLMQCRVSDIWLEEVELLDDENWWKITLGAGSRTQRVR